MSAKVLILESFYGGSHKQLVDTLHREVAENVLYVQSAKKWHWRARTGALYFSQTLPLFDNNLKFIFTSAVFNLAELIGLRDDLRNAKKVLYFHENQLEYPVRKSQERDFQYGYNQIMSCLVADKIYFNSEYNLSSFINSLPKFLKTMPDYRPVNLEVNILQKSQVLYFPIEFPILKWPLSETTSNTNLSFDPDVLKIVWPHRWEHDKNTSLFLNTLKQLSNKQLKFHVYILGQKFEGCDESDKELLSSLSIHIKHWGYLESKQEYYQVLQACNVTLSTALHEFFGVSMIEAAYCGCFPLCPKRLVYPEIFPDKCLYDSEDDLLSRLEAFCVRPASADTSLLQINFDKFSWINLKQSYFDIFDENKNK